MLCTIVGYEFQYSGKKAADEAYAQSGQYCQNQPFNKIGYIISNVIDIIVQVMDFFCFFLSCVLFIASFYSCVIPVTSYPASLIV